MSRRFLLVPFLACTLSSAVAMELDGMHVAGLAVTVDSISYASQEFSAGYFTDKWTSGNRFEINAMAQLGESTRTQPSGGGYLFYEERKWKGDTYTGTNKNQEKADQECFGIGLQGGATVHLLPPRKPLQLDLVPHLRAGIGAQQFNATDIIIEGDQYDVAADSARIEVAAGVDLRLILAKKIVVVFGGGVDYWSGAQVAIYAGSNGGGAVVGSSGTLTGTDAWVRLGAGLNF